MTDMSAVIIPKSDQLNADDLIAGSRTITITKVAILPDTEQPCSIFFEGDDGKPYKPCKSMARMLVYLWGLDAKAYTGRSLTLYRDPDVTWGALKVGGIRISHMSHIDRDQTRVLAVTKGSRKPFTVKPLETARRAPPPAERPAESASVPTEPEATRAAGQSVKARDRFLAALAKCKDLGETADLDVKLGASTAMLGEYYMECATAMQAKVDELKDPHGFRELEEWPPDEGRDEDQRQGDLIG